MVNDDPIHGSGREAAGELVVEASDDVVGLGLPCHHLLELVLMFMRIGRLVPLLCTTVPLTNAGSVHILDEGLQLMVEVLLHVDDDILSLPRMTVSTKTLYRKTVQENMEDDI